MSRIKNMLLATVAMMAVDKSPFSYGNQINVLYNSNYKVKQPHQELKEFSVKGKKVMAYSKKDAIKRLKHYKKI